MSNPLVMAASVGDWLVRRRMKHMILHVTASCNFRCEHCFIDSEQQGDDLTLPQFQRLASQTPSLMWLDIGGGEPFLRRDLAEIILSFDSRIVHIPTNGSLLPQMIEQLQYVLRRSKRELIIGLSLDGLEKTHNLLRKQRDSWNQVWRAYEALRTLGKVYVKICTVVTQRNIDDILPLMREVQQRGVDFHSVVLLRGTTRESTVHLPSMTQLREISAPMFEILGSYDYGKSRFSAALLRNFHRHLWKASLKTLDQHTQVIPCLAGQTQMVVWSNGKVSACELLPPVGDLTQTDLPDIVTSQAWQDQLQSIRSKECHCTHNCAMLDSIFFNPTQWPHLFQQRMT